jgi:hypothetical protein
MEPLSSEMPISTKQGESSFGDTASHVMEAPASIPVEELDYKAPQAELPRTSNGQLDTPDKRTDIVAMEANDTAQQHSELRQSLDPEIDRSRPDNSRGPLVPPSQNNEPRRTLRLPLAHSSSHDPDAQRNETPGSNATEGTAMGPARGHQSTSFMMPGRRHQGHHSAESFRTAAAEPSQAKEGGAFIDRALRERVDEDIATFLAAFDAALADDSLESRAGLRAATDRLLRAGARTRIELERLEARVPLPAQENSGCATSTWRLR